MDNLTETYTDMYLEMNKCTKIKELIPVLNNNYKAHPAHSKTPRKHSHQIKRILYATVAE